MKNLVTQISNLILGIYLNFCFPLIARPEKMRRRFNLISGVSAKKLKKKFPDARFETLEIRPNLKIEIIEGVINPNFPILYLHGGGYFSGSIHA